MTDIFTMDFTCSKTDKPFIIQYERKKGDRIFRIATIAKTLAAFPPSSVDASSHNIFSSSFDSNDLYFDGFKCPYCCHDDMGNVPAFYTCAQCKHHVCGGASNRLRFHCRPSCGNKALMINVTRGLASYTGSLGKKAERPLLTSNSSVSQPLLTQGEGPGEGLASPKLLSGGSGAGKNLIVRNQNFNLTKKEN